MLPHRRKSWHRWAIALGVFFLLGAPGRSYSEDPVVPFIPNPLFTTPFGPAKADIVLLPANFLPCRGTQIALCYYSGPGPTTTCTLTTDGKFANCKCYVIPDGTPYFVDINAILDLEIYQETVKKCGDDGSGCRAINSAPVCDDINNNTLFSGTDVDVISTFSHALANDSGFAIDTTNCDRAVYAGCMTAPCIITTEVATVGEAEYQIAECACPTFDGPYQVGQDIPRAPRCDINPPSANLVWSAAFSPLQSISTFPPPSCIPDAAGPTGCPLLSAVPGDPNDPEPFIPEPPSNVRCAKVCDEYKKSEGVGFTCDATLCTATGRDVGLVEEACSGLQDSPISEIFKLEIEVGCSCCASQICGCEPNNETNDAIANVNQDQRDKGITPQCDINGTLCGN